MIDIALAKTALDLWEKGLKFWENSKDRRAKLYDEIYDPLFTKLEPITQRYLSILIDARNALVERPPILTLDEIAESMIQARDRLLISRTSITGIADSYARSGLYGSSRLYNY
jgi:hypothetical protein